MRRFFSTLMVVFATAAITACGGGGSGGFPVLPPVSMPAPGPEPVEETPVCTVTLWGDSIMHGGYNIFDRLPVPPAINLKRMRPAYTVIDRSYNGGNASLSLGDFLGNDLTESRIVVLQYGVNDLGSNYPYDFTMRSMLTYAKAAGKSVVMTGIVPTARGFENYNRYNNIAASLAEEFGAYWAGWDEVEYNEGDAVDGLHPGQEYSTRLVGALAETLDLIAPECAE